MSYFVQCPLLVDLVPVCSRGAHHINIKHLDVDALYYRTKLSDDCFCSKICLLYSLVSGLAGMPTQ